ncbi:hypothetical protein [Bacillus piscicola]|uniref:hypothetical protein n=1 Tax=Bacillus piscicola TaxID=1632684 RepID=UPI001F08FCFF|nr:hypothetical protein [Bacillus piscicola]
MDTLYKQIQVYLNMDGEIDFKEFQSYYQDVLSHLNEQADSFQEDELWKGLFIVESVMSNAENRAKTAKKAEVKKYTKMAERTKLYAQNFTKRLHEAGYSQDEINDKFEEMLAEGTKEENESRS